MRNPLSLLLLLFSTISFSQGIVVDTTSLTVPQLIQNVLLQNSCFNETNFQFSSHRGIGQFTNTNAGFPLPNGIILRNGIAKHTEGPYTGLNESSQITTSGDADLQIISNNNGQSGAITDVAFLQFDFTPLSSNFSFDFLFASNEYGQYQCGFSDVFAFLLTDLTTGVTTNLAVIPGTAIPVSVKNIRDATYNSSCVSENANLFSRYNVNNPVISAINMRGETVLLTATSPVIPNRTYRIKLAIGDYNDSNFDSAVFIKGGSFTTTTNLGPDKTICQGESILLDSGLGPQFNHVWTFNGNPIPGETNTTLTVTQAGTYGVTATLPASGCIITDEIVISELQTNIPNNLTVCNTGAPTYQYDLTQNNLVTLGVNPADYSIIYFASLASANANGPQIPVGQVSNYTSTGNQTIYIKFMHITNGNSICMNLLSFNLIVNAPVNATTPLTLNFCNNSSGTVTADLTVQSQIILNGQNPANYTISYFTSQSDAQNNTNAMGSPNAFTITMAQSPQTIWVRMEDISNPSCFDVVNFAVVVSPQPLVDDIADVIECNNYTLPVITNGNYYTGPNGTGIMLNAGDIIDTGGIYYIYSSPVAPNNCSNQNTFVLTFIDELIFEDTGCGQFMITITPDGNFFTGPSGTGNVLPAGTILTTNQTIYFYSVINNVVCRDEAIPITIFPLPPVDNPADVVTCNSYTLPALTNGNYFTGSGGSGTPLSAGDVLTISQDIYVYADDGTCTDQNLFRVDIVDTAIYQPISSCGSYILPAIPFGNYYNQTLGGGTIIPAGTVITTSQTVYYYAATTTSPNCTDNLSYPITINPLPLVDTPADRLECQSYTLPALNNGNYFTDTNGGGTPLNAGDIITTT
ncbi:choice-of-anchor L domain-containing protein, partial [Flavobacterium sp.]|uniref:choice-of-anchor L domain-containing protein n=1 Tax=Flavobacterium sp. TaxID=239 RepID=UPI002B4B4679